MCSLDDMDDSVLFCKSLIQKRKAVENNNPKSSKQLKLGFSQSKIKQTTQIIEDVNESTSSYFNSKKPLNTCPLCLKVFNGDSVYSIHMKQCAKAHKMTTKQLLEALELQKKQMQERRDLGLCSQNFTFGKKTVSKPKAQNNIVSYDLALGIALSKSLTTSDTKTGTEMQKSTLEEFGFTSSTTVHRSWKKRNEINKKSVLKERTAEERQKIIVEKVAVVLLDEEEKRDVGRKGDASTCEKKAQNLKLWNMGENQYKSDWYVDQIKTLVLSDQPKAEKSTDLNISDNIEKEISELNLPQKNLHQSWKKMINNSCRSDLVVKSKDGQNVYLHSLVLFTRCPEASEQEQDSVFQKFNFSTILKFLEYLYCGTLNGLIRSDVNNLYNLARELNFKELISVLECLKNFLMQTPSSSPKLNHNEDKKDTPDIIENEKLETSEKDLFSDEVVDLTQIHHEYNKVEESLVESESKAEKFLCSFIQDNKRRKEVNKLVEQDDFILNTDMEKMEVVKTMPVLRDSEEKDLKITKEKTPQMSDDSATKDLEFQNEDDKTSAECIILSSDSESKDHFVESQQDRSKTSSPVDYEMPHFDPYDNFQFLEEQFSPVGLHSQSLLTGDVLTESFKLSDTPQADERSFEEGPKKTVGYCSTPVTVRQADKIKSSAKDLLKRSRKRSDLSASRILRKSLGLHSRKSLCFKNAKRKSCKKFAEDVANSIVEELSKSMMFQSSPISVKNYIEITPAPNKGEFGECVTPSPNYSNMGETMLKEQLAKYGLKKTLAKSKARKILHHIFEELHPLYNTKTGKIIKIIRGNSPKARKKSKNKSAKTMQNRNRAPVNKTKRKEKAQLNSSKDSEKTLNGSLEKSTDDSNESEFDDLNETLTQSMPCDPVDLPSAFSEYLENNPEYHQKILLYEPIWLEELQKKLKETFKKHFKMSDIVDYLDQKCITFRSEVQTKKLQERYKKKENSKKNKNPAR